MPYCHRINKNCFLPLLQSWFLFTFYLPIKSVDVSCYDRGIICVLRLRSKVFKLSVNYLTSLLLDFQYKLLTVL
jgi:hypothetical protein